jgi:hypothetical protein
MSIALSVPEAKPTTREEFRAVVKKIISVPRSEILKREAKYQAERKNGKKRSR